jgi:hypothetical protein
VGLPFITLFDGNLAFGFARSLFDMADLLMPLTAIGIGQSFVSSLVFCTIIVAAVFRQFVR